MRIRSVRPEFYESESMGDLSWDARFVYVCLWSYVQDNGVNLSNPKLIRGTCMPYDSDRCLRKITRALDDLEQAGCIMRYEHEGKHLLWIPKFNEYQKIKNPGICRFKTPVELGIMPEPALEDKNVEIPTVSEDEPEDDDGSTTVAVDPTDSLVDPTRPSESVPESTNPDDKKGTGVGVGVGVGVGDIITPPTPSRPDLDGLLDRIEPLWPTNRFDGRTGPIRMQLEIEWPKIVKAAGGRDPADFLESKAKAYVESTEPQFVKTWGRFLGGEGYLRNWVRDDKPSPPPRPLKTRSQQNFEANMARTWSYMTDEEKARFQREGTNGLVTG